MSSKLDNLLFHFNQLSEVEQAKFIAAVKTSGKVVTLEDLLRSKRDDGIRCPYCGSTEAVRFGQRNGIQRYRCRGKDCGKMFSDLTGSILSATRKDFQVWKRYVKCMMDGLSVRKSAAICKINRNTAFVWRHKIIDALALLATKQKRLGGIVEADETFFPLSYKGGYPAGRKSHKRGGATSKRGISREKVCVSCAIDRNNRAVSKVATLGKVTIKSLHAVLNRRISKRAILCTDKEVAYKAFTRHNGIKLVQVESGIAKLGVYHIQHINAYHSRLKAFIGRFKGVATKYLNNYLVWNNAIMETAMTRVGILRQALKAVVFTRWLDIGCRPAIPVPLSA